MNALGRSISQHALFWLTAGNFIGVVLSILLVWPQLNGTIAPFTYGRWMPLHLDWQLYGWCAMPILGMLLCWYFDSCEGWTTFIARGALWFWSISLLLGGCSWLSGQISGKIFLEWSGWAQNILPLAMSVSCAALLFGLIYFWQARRLGANLTRTAVIILLLPIPIIFLHALSPSVYPSVNPDSGGATGTSLLGSTLGVIAIAGCIPWMLRRPFKYCPKVYLLCGGWLLVSIALFVTGSHGNVSHHRFSQALILGSLLGWSPLLIAYFKTFRWSLSSRPWLKWAAAWWILLLISGWLSFLPGLSESFKFTHILVAHAHLAMAGLVTSVNAVILASLNEALFQKTSLVHVWQVGNLAHLLILVMIGWQEIRDRSDFFLNAGDFPVLFLLRLAVGCYLFVLAAQWLRRSYA